jgi:hypothetical protein
MRALVALGVGAALLLAGCARRSQQNSQADVEKAIQQYIAAKPGLGGGGMLIDVQQVKFDGDKAEADVRFQAKSNPAASMTRHYTLKRTGPNTWVVESGKSAGMGEMHPPMGGGAMPSAAPAHPPAGKQTAPKSKPAH